MKIPILFPIMIITLMIAIHYLFYSRVIERLAICKATKQILIALVILNFAAILGYMASRYLVSTPDWLYYMLSLSFGVVLLFFVMGVMYEALHLLQTKAPLDPSKRTFFKRSTDMGLLTLGGLIARGLLREVKENP